MPKVCHQALVLAVSDSNKAEGSRTRFFRLLFVEGIYPSELGKLYYDDITKVVVSSYGAQVVKAVGDKNIPAKTKVTGHVNGLTTVKTKEAWQSDIRVKRSRYTTDYVTFLSEPPLIPALDKDGKEIEGKFIPHHKPCHEGKRARGGVSYFKAGKLVAKKKESTSKPSKGNEAEPIANEADIRQLRAAFIVQGYYAAIAKPEPWQVTVAQFAQKVVDEIVAHVDSAATEYDALTKSTKYK